jgi:hypothetical protein
VIRKGENMSERKTWNSTQDVWNKVFNAFAVKKLPWSYRVSEDNVVCRYRIGKNTKCAAGLFIPDSISKAKVKAQENKSSDELPWEEWGVNFNPTTARLLNNCQVAHDDAAETYNIILKEGGTKKEAELVSREDFVELMLDLAVRYGVKVPKKFNNWRPQWAVRYGVKGIRSSR